MVSWIMNAGVTRGKAVAVSAPWTAHAMDAFFSQMHLAYPTVPYNDR